MEISELISRNSSVFMEVGLFLYLEFNNHIAFGFFVSINICDITKFIY